MTVSYALRSVQDLVLGWRYLWMKRVTAFKPDVHCARCLVGSYDQQFGLKMPVNQTIPVAGADAGAILYFCGVSTPYRWERNAHLAVVVTCVAGDMARLELYTGDILEVAGAVALPFTDETARRDYPSRSAAFLTCRNFQFGAEMARTRFAATAI